jgi:hypothetical protein
VFNNIPGNDLAPTKPEISCLQLNESEFNLQDDSQMNDIIEVSNYAKPSEVGRFLDGGQPHAESSLVQRFRKTLGKEDNWRDSDPMQEVEGETLPQIQHKKKDKPDDGLFMDLDTSGIAGDPENQPFDKNFELDNDNSFVGGIGDNNIFAPRGSSFGPEEPKDIPFTPQMGSDVVSYKLSHFVNIETKEV